jgi:hypothetical protein
MNDRPIKAHLNEEMRSHMEFVLRRYRTELRELANRARGVNSTNIAAEHALTERCLQEILEAET